MGRCTTCGQSKAWHEEHRPRHPFAEEGGRTQLEAEKASPDVTVQKGMPTDPALRIALVNAGVISYAEIVAAEQQLHSAAGRGQALVIDTHSTNGSKVSLVTSSSGEDSESRN